MSQILHPSARLKNLRETLELSQRELAKEFNVSSGAIASWELGSNPVPGPIIKLIDLYELKSESLQSSSNSENDLKDLSALFKHHQNEIKLIQKGLDGFLKEVSLNNYIEGKVKHSIAKQLVRFLTDSKGLTIKAAQLLSYLEIGLPAELRLALGNLQANLKPMPKKVVLEILKEAYGNSFADTFQEISFPPIAVTSLGQVHQGTLKSGEKIAIKVQFKDIKKTLDSQFSKISFLQKFSGGGSEEAKTITEEIRRAILEECDYLKEARNHQKIRELIINFPRTIVPKVYLNLCRVNVLVTEYIDAQNFHSFCQTASQDSKNIVAEALARTLTTLSFSHGIVLGDIHPENFLIKNDKVVYLDFGRIWTPPRNRMLQETSFYQALLLNQKEKARELCKSIGFAKDENHFNFDEFWNFLMSSSEHLLRDELFKFSREYASKISKKARTFPHKKTLKLSPEAFWGFTFSAGTWGMYAELEAECNWRRMALEVFDKALTLKSI